MIGFITLARKILGISEDKPFNGINFYCSDVIYKTQVSAHKLKLDSNIDEILVSLRLSAKLQHFLAFSRLIERQVAKRIDASERVILTKRHLRQERTEIEKVETQKRK